MRLIKNPWVWFLIFCIALFFATVEYMELLSTWAVSGIKQDTTTVNYNGL